MTQTEQISDYDQQALDFLKATGTTMNCVYTGHRPYFADDDAYRATWMVSLVREGRGAMSVDFGQSIADSYAWEVEPRPGMMMRPVKSMPMIGNLFDDALARGVKECHRYRNGKGYGYRQRTKAPTAYDVLACLTKYDPGTFRDFCADYGYDEDSRKAERIYQNVRKEWEDVSRLFNAAELEQLAEIN